MTTILDIDTPDGPARAHVYPVAHGSPRATLVLGHGAGRGVDVADLMGIARALPNEGVEVVLVEQPWSVRGAKVAARPERLDEAWTACLDDLRTRGIGVRRLVVGGRSAGARVACRTLAHSRADALLLMAFPLHSISRRIGPPPPSRMDELLAAARATPTLVVQGTRDQMGSPLEMADGLADAGIVARVVPVAWADHSFNVPRAAAGTSHGAIELVVRAARNTALRLTERP